MMYPLKNLAGNDVSIFLFRFDFSGDGIAFVLNEAIAADMYADVEERLQPLAHACCETLLRYRQLSRGSTIMDGSILTDGNFEVMLSRGLGQYFPEAERVSSPGEFHPKALAEPDVTLSSHPAPIIQPGTLRQSASARTARSDGEPPSQATQ